MSAVLLLFFLSPPQPPPPAQDSTPSHAAAHPADADLYAEAPDFHGWVGAAEASPIVKVLGDPRLADLFAELGGLAGAEPFSLDPVEALDQALALYEVDEGLRAFLRSAYSDLRSLSFSLSGVRDQVAVPGSLIASFDEVSADFAVAEQALDEQAWSGSGTYPEDLAQVDLAPDVFRDPWGQPYRYELLADGRGYEVVSFGADAEEGGALAGADLVLHMAPGDFWAASNVGEVQAALLASALRIQAVLGFASEEAAAQAFEALAMTATLQPEPGTVGVHLGVRSVDVAGRALPARVLQVPGSPLPFLVAVRGGSLLHLCVGADPGAELSGLRARLSGDSTSLADVPSYDRGLRHTGGAGSAVAPGDTIFSTYRSMPVLQLAGHGLGLMARLSGGEADVDRVIQAVQLLTGNEARATFSRYEFRDGLYHVTSFEQMPEVPVGMGRFLGRDTVKLDPETPIPGESMLVYATSLDGGELSALLLEWLATQGASDVLQWRAALAEEYGCDLDDLFGNLGGSLLLYSDTVRGLAVPRAYGFMDLRDGEAFWPSFEGFARFLADTFPEEIRLGTRPYKKVPLITFKTETMSTFVQPSFCVMDGKLIVSTSSSSLKKEIKRRLAAAEGEAPEPGPPHAIHGPGYGVHADATAVYYMDWGSALSGVYSLATTFGSMAEGLADLPFSFQSLPPPEIFSEHMLPGYHATRRIGDGLLVQGRSSFGPETSMGAALGLSLLFSVSQGPPAGAVLPVAEVGASSEAFPLIEEPAGVDAETRARDETRVAFVALRTGLAIYKIEYGSFPDTLDALVQSSDAYPNGLLEGSVVPQDGWGRALRYRLAEDGKSYGLWSVGADGVDESGMGDDISSR